MNSPISMINLSLWPTRARVLCFRILELSFMRKPSFCASGRIWRIYTVVDFFCCYYCRDGCRSSCPFGSTVAAFRGRFESICNIFSSAAQRPRQVSLEHEFWLVVAPINSYLRFQTTSVIINPVVKSFHHS